MDNCVTTDVTLSDEQTVLNFCRIIFLEKGWPLSFMDTSIREAFNQTGDVFLLAKENGMIVGCGGLKKLSEDETLMTRLYIAKSKRRIGLGTKIYNELLHRAGELKYTWIVLDVAHDNSAAIRFYEKQGMKLYTPSFHPRWKESVPGEEKYSRYYRKKL